MLARRFFYVSLGILALSVAYHLGARTVEAQGEEFVGIAAGQSGSTWVAITKTGAIYATENYYSGCGTQAFCAWTQVDNVLTGSPTATAPTSWGKLKGSFGK